MATPTDDGTQESTGREAADDEPGILRNNPLFLRIGLVEVVLVAMAVAVLQRWGDTEIGNVVFAILVSVVVLSLIPTVLLAASILISDRKFR